MGPIKTCLLRRWQKKRRIGLYFITYNFGGFSEISQSIFFPSPFVFEVLIHLLCLFRIWWLGWAECVSKVLSVLLAWSYQGCFLSPHHLSRSYVHHSSHTVFRIKGQPCWSSVWRLADTVCAEFSSRSCWQSHRNRAILDSFHNLLRLVVEKLCLWLLAVLLCTQSHHKACCIIVFSW